MPKIASWSFLFPLTIAVPLIGCVIDGGNADTANAGSTSDDPANTEGAVCVPGQSVACVCPNGSMGAQDCNANGSGFDACVCTDGGDSTGGSTDPTDPTDPTDTSDPDTGTGDTGDTVVSFGMDIKPILENSCGSNVAGCHARNAYAADFEFDCRGWVSFEDAAIGSEIYAGPMEGAPTGCPDTPLYNRLIDLNSWQCGPGTPGPGLPVVVPGDPDASYMMMKIYGVDLCLIGAEPSLVMPPLDQETYTISDEEIATLEAWILQGAQNN